MQIDITQVVVAFIGLLSAVLTVVVIPWIKSKMTAQQWDILMSYGLAAVQAAEILFHASGQGKEKLEYAMQHIEELCKQNGIKVDTATIRIVIENAWKQLGLDEKRLAA